MRQALGSLLFILLFISETSFAFELIPHSATYSANIEKGIKIKGEAIRELKKLGNGEWLYSFNVRSFAADIDESALLSFRKQTVIPKRYRYELDPVFGSTKKASTDFNWLDRSVIGTNRKKSWSFQDIASNTYDRLSYQLQLLIDISSNIHPEYKIAHKGKLKPTTFEKIGAENIDTKLGSARTIIVRKVRDKSSKRQTTLWISKDYPMLLIKMSQTEKDGEKYEIHLESAQVDGETISFDKPSVTPGDSKL